MYFVITCSIMADKGKCRRCKQSATILHHISYFPQKIIPVCRSCHDKIHDKKDGKYINYEKGDSRKYYKIKENAERCSKIPE